jgi:hypothetical protein
MQRRLGIERARRRGDGNGAANMVRIAAAVAMRQRRKLIMAATSWICGGSCYFAAPIAHRTSTKLLKDNDDRLRFRRYLLSSRVWLG